MKRIKKTFAFTILILSLLIWLLELNSCQAQTLKHVVKFSNHKYLPAYGLKKLRHPEMFQGNNMKNEYFEGWYFKMVSSDNSSILSIIPGISISKDGKEQHAFIQIIDGKTAKTNYYSFPIEAFEFSMKEFAIKIGQNYFSKEMIILNIKTDSSFVSGEIHTSNMRELKNNTFINTGIMGWYRFVPFMQCYYGVVSLTNRIEGRLIKDGKTYNFDKGVGYIEKDWGSSMPSAWIWMQTNNFSKGNSSFMLSVANVPWMGKSFTGFLGFFLLDSTIYRFATYTHSNLEIERLDSNSIKIIIRDVNNTYIINASRKNFGLLKAPFKGSMDRRISESIDAKLQLIVINNKGKVIFCDSTSIAGLEIVGNQQILKVDKKRK